MINLDSTLTVWLGIASVVVLILIGGLNLLFCILILLCCKQNKTINTTSCEFENVSDCTLSLCISVSYSV